MSYNTQQEDYDLVIALSILTILVASAMMFLLIIS